MMDYRNFSMLDLFRAEIEGQARILADGLVELEQNPVAEDYLEALMRAAHSIKGAARMVDVEPVVRISHVMEDCFVAAQNGKIVLASEDIDCLL
ncbi:MAG TPA: Hpt domain-containing protein, partial [Gammaproteobacteria bacterium]